MQEALAAVLVYGLETLNLCRIEAWTSAGNAASIRLLEKYQFRRDPQAEDSIDRSTDTMNTVIYTLESECL